MVVELFIAFVVVVAKIVSALSLTAGAIYAGMNLLDRLTHGIDEWKEIKKGNLAIALVFVAVIISIVYIVAPLITDFVFCIRADLPKLFVAKTLVLAFVNYALGLLASIVIVFLTINLIDKITSDIDEFTELKKGNIAVGLMFAVAIVLIVMAAQSSIESAFVKIIELESALL